MSTLDATNSVDSFVACAKGFSTRREEGVQWLAQRAVQWQLGRNKGQDATLRLCIGDSVKVCFHKVQSCLTSPVLRAGGLRCKLNSIK